jgi:superfamily II DNA or RNA helicase
MQKKTTGVIVARPIAGSKKIPKAANGATSSNHCMKGGFIEIWKITGTHEFNQHVLKTYQKEAGGRKSTLIFCANLDMVQDLTKKLKQAGIKADSVTTRTPKLKRLYTIRNFKTLRLKVLINCEVLTEGADLPSVCSHFLT